MQKKLTDFRNKTFCLHHKPLRKLSAMPWLKFLDLHWLIDEKQWRLVYKRRTGHDYPSKQMWYECRGDNLWNGENL